jgi:hypothetical protein
MKPNIQLKLMLNVDFNVWPDVSHCGIGGARVEVEVFSVQQEIISLNFQ